MTQPHAQWSRIALGAVAPATILAVWLALRATHRIPDYLLPSPAAVFARFWTGGSDGTLWHDFSATLQRVLKGFVLGCSLGLSFGLALGASRSIERLFGPLFLAFRQVAPFAWIPLLSLWFGGAEAGKLAFITLTAFAPSAVNSWRAARAIPFAYRELAAALTLSRLDEFRLVTFPGALPGILTGVRLSLIYAGVTAIGAELFLDIAPGLGGRLNEARDKFEIDLMLAALIALATMGLVFSQLAAIGERKLLKSRSA